MLSRARVKLILGYVDVLQAGESRMFAAEIEMIDFISGLVRKRSRSGIKYAQAKDHVLYRGIDALLPLALPGIFAFHVMVWVARILRI